MMISSKPRLSPCRSIISILATIFYLCHTANAARINFRAKNDLRHIIAPIGEPFGFLEGGYFNVTIYNYDLTEKNPSKIETTESGDTSSFYGVFTLKRFATENEFLHFKELIIETPDECPYNNLKNEVGETEYDKNNHAFILPMVNKESWGISEGEKGAPFMEHTFTADEGGFYVFFYQICHTNSEQTMPKPKSSFKVVLQTQNVDSSGHVTHLSAGKMSLAKVFCFFGVLYAILGYCWNSALVIKQGKEPLKVSAVHHVMTFVIFMKAVAMILESIRYHFISVHGHAEFWSLVYYSAEYANAVLLFSVILLLGSGWSLVRPFLQQREKFIIFSVVLLQSINVIAEAFILSRAEGEKIFKYWNAISIFMDVSCCFLVSFPSIWQVIHLEGKSHTEDSEKSEKRLKLFNAFFIAFMIWIYFTRVGLNIFSLTLAYKNTWITTFLSESGTAAFFAYTGYLFGPQITANLNGADTEKEASTV